MKSKQISALREALKSEVARKDEQIKKINGDLLLSTQGKDEKIKAIELAYSQYKATTDLKVNELEASGLLEARSKFAEASVFGTDAAKRIQQDQHNELLTKDLVLRYSNSNGDMFYKEAEEAVLNNFATAGAYVRALKQLGHNDAHYLWNKYEDISMSAEQKKWHDEEAAIKKQVELYSSFTTHGNSLANALAEHFIS